VTHSDLLLLVHFNNDECRMYIYVCKGLVKNVFEQLNREDFSRTLVNIPFHSRFSNLQITYVFDVSMSRY